MKFDIIKFKCNSGDSGYFANWSKELNDMNKALGTVPTYSDGGHYWFFFISKNRFVNIGFDNKGNLFCRYAGRWYKDKNKTVMSAEEINKTTELYLKVINIFDDFGYIIHN